MLGNMKLSVALSAVTRYIPPLWDEGRDSGSLLINESYGQTLTSSGSLIKYVIDQC